MNDNTARAMLIIFIIFSISITSTVIIEKKAKNCGSFLPEINSSYVAPIVTPPKPPNGDAKSSMTPAFNCVDV